MTGYRSLDPAIDIAYLLQKLKQQHPSPMMYEYFIDRQQFTIKTVQHHQLWKRDKFVKILTEFGSTPEKAEKVYEGLLKRHGHTSDFEMYLAESVLGKKKKKIGSDGKW